MHGVQYEISPSVSICKHTVYKRIRVLYDVCAQQYVMYLCMHIHAHTLIRCLGRAPTSLPYMA